MFNFNLQFFAHKKGVGSTKNGRDSESKRLGAKRADGTYEYESPVSFWMPFNGGIGFHDANWRSSFGGEINKTGGSHGCINLPPDRVPAFYEQVYKGMPVICYL